MRTSINLRAIAAAILFSAGLFFSQATAAQARELPSTLAMPVNTIVTHDESQSLANQLARGSQYYSSLSFAGTYQGRARHYTGKNIGISMDAECDTSGTVCDNYFSVELHRNTFPFSTYIGSEGFKRNGYTEAVWTNVGEGDYFFKFVKCNDGKWVSSDSVRMFSY